LLLSQRPPAPKPPWGSLADANESKCEEGDESGRQQRAAGTKKTALFDIVNRK
jgi:hypothetical protein